MKNMHGITAIAKEFLGDGMAIDLPVLISLARDQGVLGKLAKPLSWLLATQVGRLIGSFPSKSMIKRVGLGRPPERRRNIGLSNRA